MEIHLQFRYVSRSHYNAAYYFQSSNYFQLFWIYVAKGNKLINWFFKKTAEKTIVLAKNELSPTATETPAVDVYPFNLKFPQRIPPSFVVGATGPADGASDKPLGMCYKIVAYFCADQHFPLLE